MGQATLPAPCASDRTTQAICGGSLPSDRDSRRTRSGRKLAKRVHVNETLHTHGNHKRATLEPSILDTIQDGGGVDTARGSGESLNIKQAKAEWDSQPKAVDSVPSSSSGIACTR